MSLLAHPVSALRRRRSEKHVDHLLSELQRDLAITRGILLSGFLVGLITLACLWKFVLHEGYTIFFWALACFAVGSLVGFLFGIPRVLQRESQTPASQIQSGEAVSNNTGYHLVVNTNLDDVSDWLTKILLGVGLVEMQKIPSFMVRLAKTISGEMGKEQVPFVVSVIIYFMTIGFMSGYFTTRMFFQRAFRIADLSACGPFEQDETDPEERLITQGRASSAKAG